MFTDYSIVHCVERKLILASQARYILAIVSITRRNEHVECKMLCFMQFFNDRSCQKDVRSFVVLCKCGEKLKIEEWEVCITINDQFLKHMKSDVGGQCDDKAARSRDPCDEYEY